MLSPEFFLGQLHNPLVDKALVAKFMLSGMDSKAPALDMGGKPVSAYAVKLALLAGSSTGITESIAGSALGQALHFSTVLNSVTYAVEDYLDTGGDLTKKRNSPMENLAYNGRQFALATLVDGKPPASAASLFDWPANYVATNKLLDITGEAEHPIRARLISDIATDIVDTAFPDKITKMASSLQKALGIDLNSFLPNSGENVEFGHLYPGLVAPKSPSTSTTITKK